MNNWKNRIVGSDIVDAKQLTPNPNNWREHPRFQRESLNGVLSEVGWVQNVIVNKTTGNIVDGHLRVEQAVENNEKVPVVYVELNEQEEKLILATIDPISALAESNTDKLTDLLKTIDSGNQELIALIDEISASNKIKLIDESIEERQDDIPEVEETNVITQQGDLWEIGKHRLLCGDSTKEESYNKLLNGSKVHFTFTSPPYNIHKKAKGAKKYINYEDNLLSSDYLNFLLSSTKLALNNSNHVFVNLQMLKNTRQLLTDYQYLLKENLKDIIIWVKNNAEPSLVKGHLDSGWEYIYIFSNESESRRFDHASFKGGVKNYIQGNNNSGNEYSKIHKAAYPVYLPEWIITNLECESIMDIFSGTGTAMVAAEKNKIPSYAIEKEPLYCDISIKRMIRLFPELELKLNGQDFSEDIFYE